MGVIHKLKSEVVDFILNTKRQEPKISVRRLADVSSQKFQTVISKSSVNNVLKDAQLSSRVGRPIGEAKKQFTIPTVKKEQIRDLMQKSGLKVEEIPTKPAPEKIERSIPPIKVESKDPMTKPANGLPTVSQINENKEVILKPFAPPPSVFVENSLKEILKSPKEDVKIPEINIPAAIENPTPPVIEILKVSSEKSKEKQKEEPKEAPQNFEKPADIKPVIEQQPKWKTEKEPSLKAMGTIFLYAAGLALSNKSFIAEILDSVIAHDDLLYFPKLCQAEVFCRGIEYFGAQTSRDCSQDGFWNFLGFTSSIDRSEFHQRLVQLTFPPAFAMSYLMEKEQLYLESSAVKLTLHDGGQLLIDARAASLWTSRPPGHLKTPLNLAVNLLSNRMMANNKPLVLGIFPSTDNPLFFKDVASVFNPGGKMIKKASLLDLKGQEIAQFSVVPQIKRHFIFAVYHFQKEFSFWQKFFSSDFSHHTYEQTLTGRAICARSIILDEKKSDFGPLKLTEVVYPQTKKPFVILLSNNLEASEKSIIDEYFHAWPYGAEGLLGNLTAGLQNQNHQKESAFLNPKTAQEVFIDYFQTLHQSAIDLFGDDFCQGADLAWFVENIYLREGFLQIQEDQAYILLKSTVDEKVSKILDILTRQLNEMNICDEKGRKINVSIYK